MLLDTVRAFTTITSVSAICHPSCVAFGWGPHNSIDEEALLVATSSNVNLHVLEVWGDFACFLTPEMKVERYSYPCPTPSAARGIFEAIYFKPEFYLASDTNRNPQAPFADRVATKRGQGQTQCEKPFKDGWPARLEVEPIWADANDEDPRAARSVKPWPCEIPSFVTDGQNIPRPGQESQQRAADEQFVRRASQGKCFISALSWMQRVCRLLPLC